MAGVASAFVALLDSKAQGPVNIVSGEAVAIRHVVSRIGKSLGRPELLRLGDRPTPADGPPLLLADVRRLNRRLRGGRLLAYMPGWTEPSIGGETNYDARNHLRTI